MSVLELTTNSHNILADGPEKKTLEGLRVMQWNVLADGLAQFGDFCRVIILSLNGSMISNSGMQYRLVK